MCMLGIIQSQCDIAGPLSAMVNYWQQCERVRAQCTNTFKLDFIEFGSIRFSLLLLAFGYGRYHGIFHPKFIPAAAAADTVR